MENSTKLIWQGLVNAYDVGWDLVLINLLWAVLCSPFIFILLIALSNLNILSAVGVYISLIALQTFTTGLVSYTHGLAHGESMGWKDYFFYFDLFFSRCCICLLFDDTFNAQICCWIWVVANPK